MEAFQSHLGQFVELIPHLVRAATVILRTVALNSITISSLRLARAVNPSNPQGVAESQSFDHRGLQG